MIGFGFLLRVVQVIIYVGIAAFLLVSIVFLINRGVQLVAGLLGYEVGDFFSWLKKSLPKIKVVKRKKKKSV